MRQQQLLSGIQSFLKLYTTISISKLASFMDVDEPILRVAILMYKHKTHVINDDGSVLSNADVDFYVADDMVHIADTKVTKHFGDYFIQHISKACNFCLL